MVLVTARVPATLFIGTRVVVSTRPYANRAYFFQFFEKSEETMKAEGEHTQTAKIDIASRKTVRSAFWTGILLGIGIMAFLDETLLHQLLQWHTFDWNTDQHGRILSDGLFHAFSTLLLLWGAFRLWRGRDTWVSPFRELIVAAIIIGAGGFNLYDGIIQHAILHLHQVNELVCMTPVSRSDTILGFCRNDIPYEVVFDLLALVVLIIGILYWRHVRRLVSTGEYK